MQIDTFDYTWFGLSHLDELLSTMKFTLGLDTGTTLCNGIGHYITLLDPNTGGEIDRISINNKYDRTKRPKSEQCELIRSATHCFIHIEWEIDPNLHINLEFMRDQLTKNGMFKLILAAFPEYVQLSWNSGITEAHLRLMANENFDCSCISGQIILTEDLFDGG